MDRNAERNWTLVLLPVMPVLLVMQLILLGAFVVVGSAVMAGALVTQYIVQGSQNAEAVRLGVWPDQLMDRESVVDSWIEGAIYLFLVAAPLILIFSAR